MAGVLSGEGLKEEKPIGSGGTEGRRKHFYRQLRKY